MKWFRSKPKDDKAEATADDGREDGPENSRVDDVAANARSEPQTTAAQEMDSGSASTLAQTAPETLPPMGSLTEAASVAAQNPDYSPEQPPEQAPEQPSEQTQEQAPEQRAEQLQDEVKEERNLEPKAESSEGFFGRLKRGLGRTSDNLVAGFGNLFLGQKTIDAELLEELESQLLVADVGVEATREIVDALTGKVSRKELDDPQALMQALREQLQAILQPCEQPLQFAHHTPFVILMVGVNGVGKTTTIGKLAHRFQDEGRSVMLAAGDTFRAAAVEQLQHWGKRNDVPVIAQHTGADSASVIYDALQAATARNVDVLIADTAGRLSNQSHLMDELSKVVRVMRKLNPDAPHEVMLVLDSGTGQNALAQAEQFREAVGVSGITLTKLDGTAKGGVIFAIARRLQLPIRFIGIGEAAEDLRPFVAADFIQALFDRD